LNIINRQTIEWALYFKPYFFYFPIYNLAIGFIGIQNRKLIEKVHHRIDELTNYDWLIAGESVFRLIVEGIFFYCAIMFLEYRIYDKYLRKIDSICRMAFGKIYASCSRKKSRVLYRMKTDFEFVDTEEAVQLIKDEDPVTEQKRVKSVANCAVKVQDLNKSYTYGDMAVDNLSFALEYGECFALLGVTGAGKTSTFKCLTGEEWADSGKLSIGNYNVLDNEEAENARKLIGYCP
jgi:ABC-type multidrug transport system fused ATPase/permease subunit